MTNGPLLSLQKFMRMPVVIGPLDMEVLDDSSVQFAPEDGSADVFVHYTEIQGSGFRTLEENQKVEFEVGQGAKGPQATGVRPL